MRTVLAALLTLSFSGAAFAQKEPLQPAPVPGIDSGRVTPADRAGESNSTANSAPFSGTPGGEIANNGQPTPQTLGTSSDRTSNGTPNLSR